MRLFIIKVALVRLTIARLRPFLALSDGRDVIASHLLLTQTTSISHVIGGGKTKIGQAFWLPALEVSSNFGALIRAHAGKSKIQAGLRVGEPG